MFGRGQTCFAFPKRASTRDWIDNFEKCYFFDWNINSLKKVFDKAIEEKNITIVHCHSKNESWCMAIDEAAYCGCQVIATYISGQKENQVPGFYWIGDPNIDNNIVDELKKTILKAFNEKKLDCYIDKIQKDREYIEEQYSISNWAKQVVEVYKKM